MPTPATDPPADPRGPRFAAALTSVVLVLVLVTPTPVALVLLGWQTVVFAVGAGLGPARSPYAVLFRAVVRPRLGPPATRTSDQGDPHDGPPQRFAQTVGLVFAGAGLALLLLGASTVGLVAVGLALVAALLNAVLGLCLGCELYLLVQRARHPAPRPT